jgi:hypothetical protein
MVNGLNAEGYSADGASTRAARGLERAGQELGLTGRIDFVGAGSRVGASLSPATWARGASRRQEVHGLTTVVDGHADWRWRGLWLRGLYAHTTIGEAALINQLNNFEGDESIGSSQYGWYLQGAFDVLSICSGNSKAALLPFVRYEEYDTQHEVPTGYERNPENHIQELTLGLSYYPISRLVLKADWQQRHNAAKTCVNQFNVGLGYIF